MLSDNASHFTTLHMQTFAQETEIDWKTVDEFSPQGNRQIERLIRTLKNSLAKALNDRTNLWDIYLPNVISAYRTRSTW